MKSSFQIKLNRYFFTKVLVLANPAYDPKGNNLGSHVSNHLSVNRPEDNESAYLGELKVSIPLDKGENPPYEIDISVFGMIDITGEGQEEEISRAVQLVLMQTLYGATRELVLLLTSRGPWPGFLLPMQMLPATETKEKVKAPGKKTRARL